MNRATSILTFAFSVSLARPLSALRSCPNPLSMSQAKMSTERASGKSEHIGIKEVARQKWLALNIITYKDPKGQERVWESVSRTTKQSDEADAVGMVAVFHDPLQDCKCVILVRQYRPPMKAYTIEFPAGLIDKGETPAEAAIREMKEETGYDVTISHVSSATALDPGVGSSTLKLVKCEVDTSTLGPEYPKPTGGDGDEFVNVIVQPMNSLHTKLQELTDSGHIIDSRVYTWAMAVGTI